MRSCPDGARAGHVAADHNEHCKALATGKPCETEALRPRPHLFALLCLSAGSALGPFSVHCCPSWP